MNLKSKIVAGAVVTVGAAQSAMAEVPAAVTTALTAAGTDTLSVAGTVLGIIVGIVALKYVRRAL